jgi:putative spermidine/putrescine transport system ATP-binding protein
MRAAFAFQLGVTVFAAMFLVVPAAMSVVTGLTVNYFRGLESGLTLKWVVEVWDLYAVEVLRSLAISLACLALTLLIGVPAAYALTKAPRRLARVVEEVVALPIAVPGLALALALLQLYGTLSGFRTSSLFILAGHVLFTLPFMVRAVLAVFAVIDLPKLEEAAAALGASPWARFRDIAVPNAVAGHPCGRADGRHPLDRRVQLDMDAAHAADQDSAGRSGRRLRLDAAGGGLGLHARVFRDGAAAADRHAMGRRARAEARAMTGLGARIALSDVAKTFEGGARALTPSSIEIERGEILALLGPSGCGKTTMLRLIAGLERPDRGGAVRFDGADVTGAPVEKRNVGMVFQNYALFPNMTVRGNVGYGLKVRGVAKAEIAARVADVLALCRVSELADRPVTALSGGQRQRVALARAVAARPRVLLLDEPLSALDAGLRETLRDELAGLLREFSITSVLVTHDQSEAMAVADRVAVMRAGRILQIATPRTLYAKPADAFVATFVGGATRLGGRLEDRWIALPGGRLPAPENAQPTSVFLVRPDGLEPVADGAATLRGVVRRSIYLGDRTRLLVDGAAETTLAVDAPRDAAPDVGSPIGLRARDGAVLATAADCREAEA